MYFYVVKYIILASVKSKIHIRAGLLAIYILSLPVVLFFHSQVHTGKRLAIVKSDSADITAEDSSGCQVCNLYFDYQLYLENSVTAELNHVSYHFHQAAVDSPIVLDQEQPCPRGPPTA